MAIHYIKENDQLQELAASLNQKDEFAIDLEFDRNRYRYGFNMCLMQIYDGEHCYLIDPLSKNLDIEHIFHPIENPYIQKVVFAFGEDLRLFHSMGCFPKNLYDLDVATSLLNFEPASLTNLIQDVLDITVNSSSQQSNWYKRPLTEEQKEYAADDVLYLLDFKNAIDKLADEQGIADWVSQENAVFDQLDYSDEDHNNLIKDKDKKDLTSYEWHIYCELMKFFDEVAESFNKPVYHLVNKKLVHELATNPGKVHEWEQTKGIYGKIKTPDFMSRVQSVIDSSSHEAEQQQLSKNRKARMTMSNDEYREMKNEENRVNSIKGQLFDPIQDQLEKEFGTHARSFILPNRLTREIISGETELLPDYKVKLLRRYAEQLGLDLSDYV